MVDEWEKNVWEVGMRVIGGAVTDVGVNSGTRSGTSCSCIDSYKE